MTWAESVSAEFLRLGDIAWLRSPESPSLGSAAFEPTPALVVHEEGGGIYLGELEDGSLVRFSDADVQAAADGASMGGIFDWVKRAFTPRPGDPARGGFRELFAPPRPAAPLPPALPPPPGGAPPRRGSIFEWFRATPAAPPGPPAVRQEMPVAAAPRRGAWWELFRPQAPGPPEVRPEMPVAELEPRRGSILDIMQVPPPSMLVPAPEVVKELKPSPEESREMREVRQTEFWANLFPEPPPGADVALEDMFRPFAPGEVEREVSTETLPPVPAESLKILPLPRRGEVVPSPTDVARGLVTWYQPIDQLWEYIREKRADPAFRKDVADALAGRGNGGRIQFESLGMCDGNPDVFQAVAAFLRIPWSEIEARGEPEERTDEAGNEWVQFTNTDRIIEEIIFPASEVVQQAFELIKPRDLPGVFTLEWGGHKGHS